MYMFNFILYMLHCKDTADVIKFEISNSFI